MGEPSLSGDASPSGLGVHSGHFESPVRGINLFDVQLFTIWFIRFAENGAGRARTLNAERTTGFNAHGRGPQPLLRGRFDTTAQPRWVAEFRAAMEHGSPHRPSTTSPASRPGLRRTNRPGHTCAPLLEGTHSSTPAMRGSGGIRAHPWRRPNIQRGVEIQCGGRAPPTQACIGWS